MKTRVQKWGNSLALRVPKSFAAEIGLKDSSPVQLSLVGGGLVITPLTKRRVTLKQLLLQVTPDNLHHEVDTGYAVGNEVW